MLAKSAKQMDGKSRVDDSLATKDESGESCAKRRRSFQEEQHKEYGLLTDAPFEPDGVLVDPLGKPYPEGHGERNHSDPLDFEGAATASSMPVS